METKDFHPSLFTSPDDVEHAFYEALEHGDLEAMMACWADEEDIVCLHPNGPRLVGSHAVRQGWQHVFSNGTVRIRVAERQVQRSMIASIHNVVEFVQIQTAENEVDVALFATSVYLKTPNGWRMVLHHASAVPDDGIPEAPDSPQAANLLH